jgi:hypothetical protein
MDDKQNQLDYLYQLLFLEGMDELFSEFLNNDDLASEGYIYFDPSGYYMKLDLIESTENAEMVVSGIIDRETFLKRFLLKKRAEFYAYFKNLENQNTDKLEDSLNAYYNHLSNYHRKTIDLTDNYFVLIRNEVEAIVRDMRIQFPIIEHHKAFKILTKFNDGISPFQPKDMKAAFFEELYSITAYTLDLIDDVSVTEEMFYDVFTSPRPDSKSKITFIKKNSLIAYYLKEIEPFFNSLNPVTIDKSKCFYNKQGKALNSSDLYTSLSRSNDKDSDYFSKINKAITTLKKSYLS